MVAGRRSRKPSGASGRESPTPRDTLTKGPEGGASSLRGAYGAARGRGGKSRPLRERLLDRNAWRGVEQDQPVEKVPRVTFKPRPRVISKKRQALILNRRTLREVDELRIFEDDECRKCRAKTESEDVCADCASGLLLLCTYPNCDSPAGHLATACGAVMARCRALACGNARGHSTTLHKNTALLPGDEKLVVNYKEYKNVLLTDQEKVKILNYHKRSFNLQ